MVYIAAGVSGLTGIVGTFFVKDYLGLSAAFLAALGFWAGIPWTLKMTLGHLVDLIWRRKALLVYLGAGLITLSILIMYGIIAHTDSMREIMKAEAWFVIAALLAGCLAGCSSPLTKAPDHDGPAAQTAASEPSPTRCGWASTVWLWPSR